MGCVVMVTAEEPASAAVPQWRKLVYMIQSIVSDGKVHLSALVFCPDDKAEVSFNQKKSTLSFQDPLKTLIITRESTNKQTISFIN